MLASWGPFFLCFSNVFPVRFVVSAEVPSANSMRPKEKVLPPPFWESDFRGGERGLPRRLPLPPGLNLRSISSSALRVSSSFSLRRCSFLA